MKQTISKFLVGFLFVIGLVLVPTYFTSAKVQEQLPTDGGGGGSTIPSGSCIGADCWGNVVTTFAQVQIPNTRTGKMVYILNLDKKVYKVGEPVTVIAGVEFPTCGNSTMNVILEGQISGQPNHYTIMNQNVTGGYGIYGSTAFTPPFQAPNEPGDYVMNIKGYTKKDGWFYNLDTFALASQTPVVVMEINLPYKVVPDCSIVPAGYTKCSDEGGTCSFSGNANVAFGCGASLLYKDGTNSVQCNTATFGGDPVPGFAKSCFYKSGPVPPVPPSVAIYINDSKNPLPVNPGTEVTVTWKGSSSVVWCGETGGRGGNGITGTFKAVVDKNTTFSVECKDEAGNIIVSPPVTPPEAGLCQGTVAGSIAADGSANGPYEGQSCALFGKSTCGSSWVTHGCHWVAQ
jgi:hypothetical protein